MARIMGIDMGQRFIGIAISDETETIASGAERIDIKNTKDPAEKVAEIAKARAVKEIVVGFPLNMNGTAGPAAANVASFIEQLKERVKMPVFSFDERLTTKQGESLLLSADISRKKRKLKIDRLAAQIILQAYLDAKKEE